VFVGRFCAALGHIDRTDNATGSGERRSFRDSVPPSGRGFAPRRSEGEEVKKEAITAKQEMKKGFPRLQRAVSGNRDEMVCACGEDVDVLSLEDELAIAVADVCAQQPMKCEASVADVEASVTDKRDSEVEELRRQNGVMLQLLLAHGYKE
jgi:hypothetical protein